MWDIHPVELAAYLALFSSLLVTTWLTFKVFKPRNHHSLRSVAILVLGDIGRSPRMMYHAQSFAENGFVTDLVGYAGKSHVINFNISILFLLGSKPIPSLERLPRVRIHYIAELPKIFRRLPFLILAPIKIVHQVISILLCLLVWIETPPEFIVVQVGVVRHSLSIHCLPDSPESPKYTHPGIGSINWQDPWQQGHHRLAQPWIQYSGIKTR